MTVPAPAAVKHRVDEWLIAAGLTEGKLFRPISKAGKFTGDSMKGEKGIWHIVVQYAANFAREARAP